MSKWFTGLGEKFKEAKDKIDKGTANLLKKMDGIEYRDRTEEEIAIKNKLKK